MKNRNPHMLEKQVDAVLKVTQNTAKSYSLLLSQL